MTERDANTAFAAALVDEWARAGIEHAVIAPGSRSTPLALALVRDGRLQVQVVLDERSAAFRALGIGLATGRPAILVCTSGTAAVNFHPAVVEAAHARVPLLVTTADRPPELRASGAGQTIDQSRLYGDIVRWFCDPGPPGRSRGRGRGVANARVPGGGARVRAARGPGASQPAVPRTVGADGCSARRRTRAAPTAARGSRPRPRRASPMPRRSRGSPNSYGRTPMASSSRVGERASCPRPLRVSRRPPVGPCSPTPSRSCGRGRQASRPTKPCSAPTPRLGRGWWCGSVHHSRARSRPRGSTRRSRKCSSIPTPCGSIRSTRRANDSPSMRSHSSTPSPRRSSRANRRRAWLDVERTARDAIDRVLDAPGPQFEGRIARDVAAALPDGAALVVASSLPVRATRVVHGAA